MSAPALGGVRWLDEPGGAAGWRGEGLAWVIDPADPRRPGWLAGAQVTTADLADAARRRDAGRRLERRRLARVLIAAATGTHPAELAIDRDARGAPIIVDGPSLSIAGRAGWTIIAIGANPIGADIEIADRVPPLWDMLARGEADAVRAAVDPERAWLRHWVAKEAHAKRFGDPRAANPAAIELDHAIARSPQGISRIDWREAVPAIAAVALPT